MPRSLFTAVSVIHDIDRQGGLFHPGSPRYELERARHLRSLWGF